MSLKEKILNDIKTAMKARDQALVTTLRMLSAAIKQKEVDERIELDDAAVVAIVEKQIKQRQEAAKQFEAGGRPESAEMEISEARVLSIYLPQRLSDAELELTIQTTLRTLGAPGPQDMGRVMAELRPALAGKADMGKVSALVKAALAQNSRDDSSKLH